MSDRPASDWSDVCIIAALGFWQTRCRRSWTAPRRSSSSRRRWRRSAPPGRRSAASSLSTRSRT
eukprot:3189170-Pyramimonas_sp.AAC.1